MKIIVAAIALLSVGLSANHAINNPVPKPISDYCGPGNRGCAAALEKDYMHIGYERLPNTSSSTIAHFARACARHPDWHDDCVSAPEKVLERIGFTADD